MDNAEKTRENRLRRMADRQGFGIKKSRTRDPRAFDYGTYMIFDPAGDYAIMNSLDEVEAWLTSSEPIRRHDHQLYRGSRRRAGR